MAKNASQVSIIGGGLAGCEAALQLANNQIYVTLYDMKPVKRSPAHHRDELAEIVCSNSFGNLQLGTATGLLKSEMLRLNCQLLKTAQTMAVPAGNALAVDRELFSDAITAQVDASPYIERMAADVTDIPTETPYVIIATGPLTSPGLTETLQNLLNQKQLYFFDAAAPILTRESINFDIAFYQDRYNQSASSPETEAGNYINCPLNKDEYNALIDFLIAAEKIPLKSFENDQAQFFESCLPVEVLASRGRDTLRYGPMKPVGIDDPRTGRWPYANIQLRQDNTAGTLYNIVGFQTNLKWSEQKTLINQFIPGLEKADVVRYGVMHRNTFINSPNVLMPTMQLRNHHNILIAGQLTGVEGYTESIASGLVAAQTTMRLLNGETPTCLPQTTMLGALFAYITREGVKHFQPINSNWGILPPLDTRIKDKKARNAALVERAQIDMDTWLKQTNIYDAIAV